MARHSDFRTYLGTHFPLITLSGNIDFIDQVVAGLTPEDAPGTVRSFMFNDQSHLVTVIKPGIVRINASTQSYQVQDLVKVRYEFATLLADRGDILYSDIFFKAGDYPASLEIDQEGIASFNARVYSAAMKRAYNWHRFGSDGDIHISHHPGSKVLATVIISEVTFNQAHPVIHFSIIVGEDVVERSVEFPYAIKYDRKNTRSAPKPIPYDQFIDLLEKVRARGYGDCSFTLIDKLSSGLQARQGTGPVDVFIHPGIPDRLLKANHSAQHGGVLFYEINTRDNVPVLISDKPITLTDLRLTTTKYWEQALEQERMVNVTPFSAELFDHTFFEGGEVYSGILESLRIRIKRGDKTLSHITSKSVKLRFVTWNEGRPYYTLECVRNGNLFIFKDFIDMSKVIDLLKAGEENSAAPVVPAQTKLGFMPRLKMMLGGLFA